MDVDDPATTTTAVADLARRSKALPPSPLDHHHLDPSSSSLYAARPSISTQYSESSTKDPESFDESAPTGLDDMPFPYPARHKGTYRIADFAFLRTLGTGSFGRVHLVRSKHNGRFYAIKVLNKEKVVAHKQIDHTNNEQQMLLAVQHPFIVNLWGTFQDPTNLYMVMDFVPGGELFTLLRRSNRFPEPVAKFYAAEVALALNHLHDMNVVYRDLKPENILLAVDGHIKVADFGFAKYCPNTTWTLCGTPDYLAPEVVQQRRYNKSVDWYALGILIYEMLTGLPPFHRPDDSPLNLYARIQMGAAAVRWPLTVSMLARDVILRFLEADPSKRFGNLRNGAGDVFGHAWFREVDWTKLRNREITAPYLPRVAGAGDASAFEAYAEDGAAAMYGVAGGSDPHGAWFPDFEYTAATATPGFGQGIEPMMGGLSLDKGGMF